MENESMPKENNIEETDEKLSTLKEVVEKVVELYVIEDTIAREDAPEQQLKSEKKSTTEEKNKNNEIPVAGGTPDDTTIDPDTEPIEQPVEAEQPPSPSQSASSRATRWEALADIAAQLPPSLAVDPLTGQIYTVTK